MFKNLILSGALVVSSAIPVVQAQTSVSDAVIQKTPENVKHDFEQHRTDRAREIENQFVELSNATDAISSVKAIVERYAGHRTDMEFHKISKHVDASTSRKYDVYSYEVTNHKLVVEGSSVTAMAHGWYEWLKINGYGMVDWEDQYINIPTTLVDEPKVSVTSPYEKHIFGNQASVSYSQIWWDKYKWMDFSSWLALHGYDLAFDLIGRESVYADLYRSMGLSDEVIRKYESGPAYSPFQQIGCVNGVHSNPYFFKYADKRKALNHDLLNMFHKLGITPIAPGFTGFVPEELKDVEEYKDIKLVQTQWSGNWNHVIDPSSGDTFKNIQKKYIQLYEAEYGPQDFYVVDSFNEVTFPGNKHPFKQFAHDFATQTHLGIEEGTKNHVKGSAVWVMQGWTIGWFRYTSEMWSYDFFHEFFKDVPDDKVLLMDEAVDYNAHLWAESYGDARPNFVYFKEPNNPNAQSFDGKMWSYSTIPSMGANTGINGDIKWYASAGPEALKLANNGHLYAYGNSTEGIDNAADVQELISDMGWKSESINFDEWIKNYSINRYGFWNNDLKTFWDLKCKSLNGHQEDHIQFTMQTYGKQTSRFELTETIARSFKVFAKIAKERREDNSTKLFIDDLYSIAALYDTFRVSDILNEVNTYSTHSRIKQGLNYVRKYMPRIDRIIATHSSDRMARWIKWARQWGDNVAEKTYYASDAKMQITWWMNEGLNNYAAKIWSGLVGGYYQKKAEWILDKSLEGNYHLGDEHTNVLFPWIENDQKGESQNVTPYSDPFNKAISIIEEDDINLNTLDGLSKPGTVYWSVFVGLSAIAFAAIITIVIKKRRVSSSKK